MEILKENTALGIFVPIQMKYVNKTAHNINKTAHNKVLMYNSQTPHEQF
jgi:hypothetical protein